MTQPYLFHLGEVKNEAGTLNFWEPNQFPFEVKRVFWITGVPEGEVRGIHAHKTDDQVTVCIQGSVKVRLEGLDGSIETFTLDASGMGLFLPRLVWSEFHFSANSVLLVFSTNLYDEDDYIRDKNYFDKLKNGHSEEL